jgi:hypothetical protein
MNHRCGECRDQIVACRTVDDSFLPASGDCKNGECLGNVILNESDDEFRILVVTAIGEAHHVIRHGIGDALVLGILYTDYYESFLFVFLFDQSIEFALVFKSTVNAFKLCVGGHVRNGDRDLDGNGLRFIVTAGIETLGHLHGVLVLQTKEDSVVAHGIHEQNPDKDQ